MVNQIIGSIVYSPLTPMVGESVLVQVLSPQNVPYNNNQQEYISINGISGSKQYLQFKRAGLQSVKVFASNNGNVEKTEITIDVKNTISHPILRVSQSKYQPYVSIFTLIQKSVAPLDYSEDFSKIQNETNKNIKNVRKKISNINILNAALRKEVRAIARLSSNDTGEPILRLQDKLKSLETMTKNIESDLSHLDYFQSRRAKLIVDNIARSPKKRSSSSTLNDLRSSWRLYKHEVSTQGIVKNQKIDPNSDKPSVNWGYLWNFGDGSWEHTQLPLTTHNFQDSLHPDRLYNHFDVSVTNGWTGVTLTRTLTVNNIYYMNKKRGILQPPIISDFTAKIVDKRYVAHFIVKNLENTPIELNNRCFIPMHPDPNHLTKPLASERIDEHIPAKGSKNINVEIDMEKFPTDSPGFSVHYAGTTQGALYARPLKVRISSYYEIPENEKAFSRPVWFSKIRNYKAIDIRPFVPEDPRVQNDIYSIDEIENVSSIDSAISSNLGYSDSGSSEEKSDKLGFGVHE